MRLIYLFLAIILIIIIAVILSRLTNFPILLSTVPIVCTILAANYIQNLSLFRKMELKNFTQGELNLLYNKYKLFSTLATLILALVFCLGVLSLTYFSTHVIDLDWFIKLQSNENVIRFYHSFIFILSGFFILLSILVLLQDFINYGIYQFILKEKFNEYLVASLIFRTKNGGYSVYDPKKFNSFNRSLSFIFMIILIPIFILSFYNYAAITTRGIYEAPLFTFRSNFYSWNEIKDICYDSIGNVIQFKMLNNTEVGLGTKLSTIRNIPEFSRVEIKECPR